MTISTIKRRPFTENPIVTEPMLDLNTIESTIAKWEIFLSFQSSILFHHRRTYQVTITLGDPGFSAVTFLVRFSRSDSLGND
jgi:hypothetical protein